jgi:hypothetical protein|tara:strand:+ start:59 stop:1345 length:1287 start_codon:yes stop_codon:yes gene_type:complete
MKSIKQIREASGGKEAYQKFFNSILKRFGVGSPAELEGDAKKKFYDAIDAGWDGDNEKPEPGDKKNENTDDFKSDEDVPDDKGNYTMGDMAESPAIAVKVAAAIDKKNEKKKSVKEIRVKPVDEKMGMCEQCGTMHEEGDCPQSDMDMSDLDPDTKGMAEAEIKEKSKLKAGKGKITVDLNWDGTARDKKFAETKYGIKLKITRTGALATGEKARVLAYVSGQDYAMDDADIEDLMPEILEARGSDLSSAELKKAEKIAKKHSGDMKKAMAEIEKIKKGSSESDAVMTMLKKHNEDTTEDMYMHTSKKKRKLKAHKGDHMDEAVSVDRRTMGFKEAMKRRAEAKAKREAKKIKDAKSQAKSDMASIDANYAYDGDVAEILASANKSIMGQHEDAAANASSSGAVDMNTNGKSVKKKKDKENLMAKYGY